MTPRTTKMARQGPKGPGNHRTRHTMAPKRQEITDPPGQSPKHLVNHQNGWKPTKQQPEIHRHNWKVTKTAGNPPQRPEIHRNGQKSTETARNPPKQPEIHRNSRKSTETARNPPKWPEIHRNSRKSTETARNPPKRPEIHRNVQKSTETARKSPTQPENCTAPSWFFFKFPKTNLPARFHTHSLGGGCAGG